MLHNFLVNSADNKVSNSNGCCHFAVTLDRMWQKRYGFSALSGVVWQLTSQLVFPIFISYSQLSVSLAVKEAFGKIFASSKMLWPRFQVSEIALMGHAWYF